jgi:hypothetical protein
MKSRKTDAIYVTLLSIGAENAASRTSSSSNPAEINTASGSIPEKCFFPLSMKTPEKIVGAGAMNTTSASVVKLKLIREKPLTVKVEIVVGPGAAIDTAERFTRPETVVRVEFPDTKPLNVIVPRMMGVNPALATTE